MFAAPNKKPNIGGLSPEGSPMFGLSCLFGFGVRYPNSVTPMAKSRLGPKGRAKAERVFHEFGQGKLHSGSKRGPTVTNAKQATAIALSEGRKAARAKR